MTERDAISKLLWLSTLKAKAKNRAQAAWDALPPDGDKPDFNIFRNAVITEALANANSELKAKIKALIAKDKLRKAQTVKSQKAMKRCVLSSLVLFCYYAHIRLLF